MPEKPRIATLKEVHELAMQNTARINSLEGQHQIATSNPESQLTRLGYKWSYTVLGW